MADTIIDTSNRTIRDDFEDPPPQEYLSLKQFRGYTVEYAYPATGGEADLFRLEKDNRKYIGKLYRKGIVPNEEILKIISEICKKYPDNFVQLLEYGLDPTTNLWFEILQFESHGSLKEILGTQPNSILQLNVRNTIEQIFRSISILHQYQILHLDLKPENILVHSLHPFTVVLTDFGVSSILPANIVSKMTRRKGTPEYWAPEQLSGIVGKKTDYWALGIVTLELLTSQSLFKNINQNRIEYEISTKGIQIPNDLPQEYSLLLKGLLTRDPEKRWGEQEVLRWINNERDIPVHYEYSEKKTTKENIKPYRFHGSTYYSLESLVAACIESPETWDEAVKHLGRGYILKWLEDIGEYDKAVSLEKTDTSQLEWKLFDLIYTNNSRLPFSVFGKLIDESNLYLYLGRSLRKESSDVEERIIASWKNGELEYFAEQYVELTGKNPPAVKVISLTTGINADNLFPIFDLLNHPEKYHLPDVIDSNDSLKTVELLSSAIKSRGKFSIFTEAEFNNIASNFIIPDYLVTKIRSKYFPQAYDEIIKLKEHGISRQHLIESDNKFIIPQYIKSKIQSENFLEGYTAIKNVERVALTKKQIQDLESEYIIPLKITSQFKTEKYANAYRELQNLISQNLLIKQSTGTRDDLSNTGTKALKINKDIERSESGTSSTVSINEKTPPTPNSIIKPVWIVVVGIIIICLLIGVYFAVGNTVKQPTNVDENNDNPITTALPSNYQKNGMDRNIELGNAYLNADQFQEALDYYDKAILSDSNSKEAWNGKGWALHGLARYQEALVAHNKAISIDPNYADAWYGKGWAQYSLSRYQEALDAYNKSLSLDSDKTMVWTGKGNALKRLGRYQEALDAFDKAISLSPNNVAPWTGKGDALYSLGSYQEALDAYNKAISCIKRYMPAWNGKGNALYSLGRYQEALDAYNEALSLYPDNEEAKSNKQRVIAKMG